MIPDQGDASCQRKANGNEYPIRQFAPVFVLNIVEGLGICQLPGAKDIHFMRLDGAYVVEAKSEIEEKKELWVHVMNRDLKVIPSPDLNAATMPILLPHGRPSNILRIQGTSLDTRSRSRVKMRLQDLIP